MVQGYPKRELHSQGCRWTYALGRSRDADVKNELVDTVWVGRRVGDKLRELHRHVYHV